MTYKHILVVIDLSVNPMNIMKISSNLANDLNAKLSLITVYFNEINTGLIQLHHDFFQEKKVNQIQDRMEELKSISSCSIANTLILSGDKSDEICNAIKELEVDLVISNHHEGIWGNLFSDDWRLIQHINVDLLMIQ